MKDQWQVSTYALLGVAERSIDLLEAYLPLVSKDAQMWFLHDSDLEPIRSRCAMRACLR